jgi:hypothetical protein
MNKPSVMATIKRSFKLESYPKVVVPIFILGLVVNYMVEVLLVSAKETSSVNAIPTALITIFALPFISCLYMIAFHAQYHKQPITFFDTFMKASKRWFSLYLTYLIIFMPLLVPILLGVGVYSSASWKIYVPVILFLFTIIMIYVINISLAGVIVVTQKNRGAWESIKMSWKITRPYRMKTFLLTMIYSLVVMLVASLNVYLNGKGKFIINSFSQGIFILLFVIWYEQLNNANLLKQNNPHAANDNNGDMVAF